MKVYGYLIDIIKEIKDKNKGNKHLSDSYVLRVSAALGAKATILEAENLLLKKQIKILDISLYYRYIDPSSVPKEGGFSGGGW